MQDHAQMGRLPAEILEAGVVKCTGLIHACSLGMPALWASDFRGIGRYMNKGRMDWPEESGGQRTVEKIQARCRQVRDRPLCDGMTRREAVQLENLRKHPDLERVIVDPVLYELLEPERRRQQTEMLQAIDRVCELVESRRKGQLG